jgi:hypothetical protein
LADTLRPRMSCTTNNRTSRKMTQNSSWPHGTAPYTWVG